MGSRTSQPAAGARWQRLPTHTCAHRLPPPFLPPLLSHSHSLQAAALLLLTASALSLATGCSPPPRHRRCSLTHSLALP
eukprot:7189120-Prymnesium_polylepis.1